MTLKKLIELHGIKHVNIRFSPNTPSIDNQSLLDCSLSFFKDDSGETDYTKLVLSNTSKKFSRVFSFQELEQLDDYIAYVITHIGKDDNL